MTVKKMAILRITPEALREMLQLPPETEVVRVDAQIGARGVLNITIVGAGWDVAEGGSIMWTDGAIVTNTRHLTLDGHVDTKSFDWRLPKDEA